MYFLEPKPHLLFIRYNLILPLWTLSSYLLEWWYPKSVDAKLETGPEVSHRIYLITGFVTDLDIVDNVDLSSLIAQLQW